MEWIEYASFRPFGERAADIRAAIMPCMVSNAFGKRGTQRKIEDFLISREPKERKVMTGNQIEAVLRAAYTKQEQAKRGGNSINRR